MRDLEALDGRPIELFPLPFDYLTGRPTNEPLEWEAPDADKKAA